MEISSQQPMRSAEIDLVDQVNTNTGDIETNQKNLAHEVTDRTNADTAIGNRITQETNRATEAENTLTNNLNSEISRAKEAEQTLTTNLNAEISRAKAAEEANATAISSEVTRATEVEQENATAISDETARAKAAEEANAHNITNLQNRFPIHTADISDLQVTTNKLEDSIQQHLTFLQTVPAIEFGTSNSVDVSANSSATVDITFGSLKTKAPVVLCGLQHESGNLACIVSSVTNQQCSIIVYNLTNTDVTGVTVDYLAMSRR